MMQRYSSDINAPSASEGDSELLGVDSWSAPENIRPGFVQEAVNADFTSGDGVTRGGFVCIPQLASQQFDFTWTEQTPASATVDWSAIAFGSNVFVAVGASGSNRCMTSSDGVTWTTRSPTANSDWAAITWGDSAGRFVAVATSTDTVEWHGVAFGNGVYVAVGHNGTNARVMTSSNGNSWTARTASATTTLFNAVCFGNGLFVAVGEVAGTDAIMTSPDGITWTTRTASESGITWTAVTFGGDKYVAVSSGAAPVMYSTDGITWTSAVASAQRAWRGITYGDGYYVAVGSAGIVSNSGIMVSRDAITWTANTRPVDLEWCAIAYGNGLFAAVAGNAVSATSSVMTTGALQRVYASGNYSDPDDLGSQWIALVKFDRVTFNAFGRTTRTVDYASGLTVSEQSTIVQANNLVYIFRGPDAVPLRWSGNWADDFELATGSIPSTTQALYAQNRLWCIDGKDTIRASDVLDFTTFNALSNSVNIGMGDSNYLVTLYPFGDTTILAFKNRSITALTNVDGSLTDIVASEITRQQGAIGINSVLSVGPDVVYMSDRNINLVSLTSTNNALQHKTLPLSRNIQKIFDRVNWDYAYKVSMGFYDNKLFVALPLDNSTTCNAVCVYNFVTEAWFGEWNFDSSLGIGIQNFVVANYLGLQRLHAVTEDGRIFVVGEGPLDVSGTTFAEISSSITTRAYSFGNQNHIPRRMYIDISTWRPTYSVTAYADGVNESTEEVTDQTYLRSQSWIFNDSTYALANTGDDYNRQGRKDYSCTPSESVQPQSGFLPEAEQEVRVPIITRRKGRLSWLQVTNTQGLLRLMTVGFEARAGDRGNFTQAI
jgi:hypothetical protein